MIVGSYPLFSRGAIFEVLADKFESCKIANIQRQNENRGREVPMCLSRKDARTGLSILQQEGRIKRGDWTCKNL